MEFVEEHLPNIKTPILAPKTVRLIGLENSKVRFLDFLHGVEFVDEVHFFSGREALVLNTFRKYFPVDTAIIMLFSPTKNLYLQKRGLKQKWQPGKIDLASVAGARNAILKEDHFENENWEETALREMSEETSLPLDSLDAQRLIKLGEYYNPLTNENQAIFAYQVNASLEELNKDVTSEVEEWLEQSYDQAMAEYYGDQVEKYAGGAELREVNFLTDPTIKKALDDFYRAL